MIIVTGGAGFIGSAFISKLNAEGVNDIIVVDELKSDNKWHNLNGKLFYDYINKDKFIKLIEDGDLTIRVDAIVHMGACSSTTETDGEYMMANNYSYTKTLADWAINKNIRFIYASSAATYGDGSNDYIDNDQILPKLRPLNLYGFSKHAFDLCAMQTGALKRICGLKFFNVYGPNEYHKGDMASVAYKGYKSIKETGKIKLFKSHDPLYKDGEFYRDFVYVKDCVDVMWWLLQKRRVTGLFNLGTGKAATWNELANALFKAMEVTPNIEYIDMPTSIRSQYQYRTEASMEKLKKAGCQIQFRDIESGVDDYVKQHLSCTDIYY